MLLAGVGHSDDIDTLDAIDAALDRALATFGARPPLAGLLFASIGYDLALAAARVRARAPGLALCGCSANGTLSRQGYMEDGVLVALFGGDAVAFGAGLGRDLRRDPVGACRSAVEAARRPGLGSPALCLAFPDPLSGDMEAMISTLRAELGDVPVFGGSASDDWRLAGTLQVCGDAVVGDALPILLVYGDLAMSAGIGSGWTPIGPAMRVTSARGPVVHTVDHRPLMPILEENLGVISADGMLDHPLAVYPETPRGAGDASGDFFLRALMAADPETGTVTACGTVPEGAMVRLTAARRAAIIEGAGASLSAALDRFPASVASCCLIFSCAVRQTVLGMHASMERDVLTERLASRFPDAPMIGFYGYGEIGEDARWPARFHNETCVSLLLGTS